MQTSDLNIGPIRSDEIHALDAIIGPALHFPPGLMSSFIQKTGVEEFRVVRCNQRIVAGYACIMMGQWFGGVTVPMAGVSAVGVAPDMRGSGVGSTMLRTMLEELHSRKMPLAALYPATLPFYQRAGFERAGQSIRYELPLEAIDPRMRPRDLVPFGPEAYEEVRQAYNQQAALAAGNLDRPDWMWNDRLEPQDTQPFRFRVVHDGRTEGFIVYTQGGRTDPLKVADVCILTPEAGRSILALLGGYRSMVETVVWNGGPLDPFLFLLPENLTGGSRLKVHVVRSYDWMLRIVDVTSALTSRGYPPGVTATLHLDVRDEVLPHNNERFVLVVADGHGQVRPGGEGRIGLHVRDLAALYTGFMTAFERRLVSTVEGSEHDLALMSAAFAGPRPWIGDMF